MIPETVEVTVNGLTAKYYEARGYDIPRQEIQLWAMIDGKRRKNGKDRRVVRGTKIMVRTNDLMPSSNEIIHFMCPTCSKPFTTTWGAHRRKKSNNCKSCQAKRGFKGGCHSYWVDKLIISDAAARCDISGEIDKRFLELHHLRSRSLGGKDEQSNYVILSANYHRAFHNWMGGSNIPSTPEDYAEFKRRESNGEKPRRRADILSADWCLVE